MKHPAPADKADIHTSHATCYSEPHANPPQQGAQKFGEKKQKPVRIPIRKANGPEAPHPTLARNPKQPPPPLTGSEERLHAILQTAVEGIITIDARGHIESVNPAAERIFGYQQRELIGRNVNLLMPSPHQENHDQYLANYRRTGKARIIGIGREVQGRRKDGSVFPMDLAVSEVRLPDRLLFTGFVRDISERKELEGEILRISEVEQRRIGQDLHDGICQQLSGIELMTRVLEGRLARAKSPEARQAARIAEHLQAALAETRRLSRGLSPIALEQEGLGAALGELASRVEEMFGVRCRCRCRPGTREDDILVNTHLYRIAQEAVNNAIRHGKPGSIEIGLSRTRTATELVVRDDGRGIPSKAKPGPGMGLKIMNYRAQIIGARLVIERSSSGGTTVTCVLPHAEHQKTAHEKTETRAARGS